MRTVGGGATVGKRRSSVHQRRTTSSGNSKRRQDHQSFHWEALRARPQPLCIRALRQNRYRRLARPRARGRLGCSSTRGGPSDYLEQTPRRTKIPWSVTIKSPRGIHMRLVALWVWGHAMKSTVAKRSIIIAGHKTSISLENEFWEGLREIASERDQTLSHWLRPLMPSGNTPTCHQPFGYLCLASIAIRLASFAIRIPVAGAKRRRSWGPSPFRNLRWKSRPGAE